MSGIFVRWAGSVAQYAAFAIALVAVTVPLWLTMRFSAVIHRRMSRKAA